MCSCFRFVSSYRLAKKAAVLRLPQCPPGMQARISGVPWTATTISYSSTGNDIEISGADSLGRTIDLRIKKFKTTGIFTLQQGTDSAFYYPLVTPAYVTAGAIAIQSVNDTAIIGTFSFTLEDPYAFGSGSMVISGGTFNWNYN